ncbi:MAG: alpha/beta hydrolase [Bacteroidales bacterium]|nr:alpha/beta hydrolase [Bacteroidales bacterium]
MKFCRTIRIWIACLWSATIIFSSAMAQAINVMSNQFVNVDGVNIHYRSGGNGPFLLLLHGFTLSNEQWEPFYEKFFKQYTVIAPDFLGHGKSDRLDTPFSYDRWAGIMFHFLDSLNIDETSAIGHSAGAITLLHMLEQNSHRFRSVVLISGALRMSSEGINILKEDSYEKANQGMQSYYLKIHFNDRQRIDSVFSDIRLMAQQFPTEQVEISSSLSSLSSCTVPVFLIWGERDVYFPVEIALELYNNLPDVRLWVIPGQGHTPVWEAMGGDKQASASFPDRVMEFFDRSTGK